MPVFSSSVFGCARREISTSGGKTFGMKRFIAGPITIAISPIAQHALLQTEINSTFFLIVLKNILINKKTNQDSSSTPTRESTGQHAAGRA